MGLCHGNCGREMFRGDMFVMTLADQLLCVDCWAAVPGVDAELHAKSMAVVDAFTKKPEQAQPANATAGLVWDGDFPD